MGKNTIEELEKENLIYRVELGKISSESFELKQTLKTVLLLLQAESKLLNEEGKK